jgi:hypothetical protein
MQEIIRERVSVITVYDRYTGSVMPVKVRWQGKLYYIKTLGYYHRKKEGRTLLHVFSVATSSMFFKLVCDSETLHWTLEEVSDGLTD